MITQGTSHTNTIPITRCLFFKDGGGDAGDVGGEETYAAHGNYVSDDSDPGGNGPTTYLMEGLTINERFEAEPREYFEDKIMTAVFRKVSNMRLIRDA